MERVQAQRKRTGRSQESRLIFFWGPRGVRGDPYGLLRGIQGDPEATILIVPGISWISSVGIRKPKVGFWGDCGNHYAAAARAIPAASPAECGRPGETDKPGFYLKTPVPGGYGGLKWLPPHSADPLPEFRFRDCGFVVSGTGFQNFRLRSVGISIFMALELEILKSGARNKETTIPKLKFRQGVGRMWRLPL